MGVTTKEREQLPDNVITDDGTRDKDGKLKARRERFGEMRAYWSDIHDEGMEDDRFIVGGDKQWDSDVAREREEEGRPFMTYNQLPSMVRQITNKVRQDRPQLRIKPVESDRVQTPDISNVQGTSDYSLADVYMGLWRNMEHISRADIIYDTSIKHAADHGFGYFRMNTRYCRHDPFVQELYLERIKNSYGVYLDPGAQDAVFQDAQDAFMFTALTREAFETKYPGKQFSPYGPGNGQIYDGWYDKDNITIATYYWVDWVDDEVVKMSNGKIHYWSIVQDVVDDMKDFQGIYVLNENGKEMRKSVKRPVVKWQKMSAVEMLTEETETVFETIPIFPVLGEEHLLEGRTIYKSAIRDAKDAQISYNYHRTAQAETAGMSPKAPYMLTPRQIEGHEGDWDNLNKENLPYLLYNPVDGVEAPKRNAPPAVDQAALLNAQQDLMDMRFIVGINEADMGLESNEKSGKAILARQQQGMTSTFTFPDNLNRAIEAAGRCFVQAAPRIFDTSRVLRVRLPNDTEDFVEINKLETDKETGKQTLVHDIAYGKYDVAIDTGPSYQTQREEAVEAMLELLKVLPPELAQLVVHLIVDQMGFPGADQVAAVLRKALPDHFKSEQERAADLPKGVIFNDDGVPVYEDSGDPYEEPPSPEQQTRQAEAAATQAEKEAETTKHQATIATAQAKTKEAEVKMAEIQQGGEEGEPDYSGMIGEIQAIIAEEFEKHANDPNAHKQAIETVMAEAVVDILRRVKRYVDGETKKLAPPEPKITPQSESGDMGGGAGGQAAGSGPAPPPSAPVNVIVEDKKPSRVRIESDGDSTTATPEYDDDPKDNVVPITSKISIDNIQRDSEGRISGAAVTVLAEK